MSLALGQNPSYINRIENGEAPREVRELMEKIEKLTPEQRTLIRQVVEQFLGE